MKKIILALCFLIHIIIVAAAAAAMPVLCVRIVIMADLRSRCGHYIFILSFFFSSPFYFYPAVSSFFFLFFPRLISAVADWGLPYFHTWCGLSANLGCRSETCCTRLAENTGRKKSPSGHHCTTLSGYIFATKACINNRKKLVK